MSFSLRHLYRNDEAVFIKFETVNADYAVVSVGGIERMAMVDNVVIVATSHDAVMSGTCSVFRVAFKNSAYSFKWTVRGVGNGVGNTVVVLAPAPFAPHEVELTVTLNHKRPLYITFRCDLTEKSSVFERNNGREVIREPDEIAVAPSAVEHQPTQSPVPT